jgi:hypothetical protein
MKQDYLDMPRTLQKAMGHWSLVTGACNLSYLEAEIQRIKVQGQPGQTVIESSSPK